MHVKNRFDKSGEAFAMGKQAETSFESVMADKGFEVVKSSKLVDIKSHIDFILTKDGKSYTVDVKSEKKVSRNDNEVQSELLWCEFKNVQGYTGSMYGQATHLAFQRQGEFNFILREDFVKRVESLVTDEQVFKASNALYKKYTRFGRKDVISLIKWSDVKDLVKAI